MKKFYKIIVATILLSLSLSVTAFAGTWKQEAGGWWWQNDDGSYPRSTWQWIDGNGDGIAESYYFDENGYLLTDTTTPDGYTVNQDGAWVSDGVVQKKQSGSKSSPEGIDARQLYLEASRKNNQLTSMAADSKIKMSMSMQGETIPVDMTMDMKFKDLNTSSMKYLSNINMNMLGIDMGGTIFYADGYYYMDMMGQKQKFPMDLATITQEVYESSSIAGADDTAAFVQNAELTEDGNGNKVVAYNSNASEMNTFVNSMYSQMGMNVNNANIKSISGTAVINSEGYIISETFQMYMDVTSEGQVVNTDVNMQIDYINLGQPVDFALPSTEGYVDGGTL